MGILLKAGPDAAAAGSMAGGSIIMIIYIILIFAFIYFFMIRPQKKEQKKVAAMLSALEIGDCILTSSGFYGIVIDITDDTVIVAQVEKANAE